MLELTWFSILVLCGLACAVRAAARGRDPESHFFDEMGFALASFSLLGLSLAASSDHTVLPVYEWLRDVLPEHGAPINQLTAIVLTGAACVAFAFGVPFAIAMAAYHLLDVADASRTARHAIARARALKK